MTVSKVVKLFVSKNVQYIFIVIKGQQQIKQCISIRREESKEINYKYLERFRIILYMCWSLRIGEYICADTNEFK